MFAFVLAIAVSGCAAEPEPAVRGPEVDAFVAAVQGAWHVHVDESDAVWWSLTVSFDDRVVRTRVVTERGESTSDSAFVVVAVDDAHRARVMTEVDGRYAYEWMTVHDEELVIDRLEDTRLRRVEMTPGSEF